MLHPSNNTHSDITFAKIDWQNGQPYSPDFGDVYFSTDDGLVETHYVFIAQNQLEHRFKHLQKNVFTIIETGFGTGLNFLCVWMLWLSNAPANAQLHYIACEKYPLTKKDLTTALRYFPTLSHFSTQLIERYNLSDTQQTMSFAEGRIKLTLLIGDGSEQLSLLSPDLAVDAWFLDGFSPNKNPDMWSNKLFKQMARLSNTGSTFATFTSAGLVKRGLHDVGFSVKKVVGFGKKREMLAGYFSGTKLHSAEAVV